MTRGDLVHHLDAGWAGLQALRARVEAGEPWPLSPRFDNAPEAYWYPPEVLAHVSELVERWLGVVETILAGASEPVPFGQAGPAPARLEGIERNRHLGISALYSLIGQRLERMRARVSSLSERDLVKRGVHPTRGETTIAEILKSSVTDHIEEHVRQLQGLLEAAGR